MYKLSFVLLFTITILSGLAQAPRKAQIGLKLIETKEGLQVDSVLPAATFTNAALQKGDIIISFNGKSVCKLSAYNVLAAAVRSGEEVNLVYLHNGKELKEKQVAKARPFYQSDIADVKYDWVKFRQGGLRTITYIPKRIGMFPAILLIPGYGCGSIENYPSGYNGKLIDEWVKNGYVVVTVEKSGMGDSYNCEPCTQVDLVTDIESFDAGYRYMEQLPMVDKQQLIIWGHSMGGTIAPEIAVRHHPKAVMVFACVFRPWNEFLLEMHRVQKPLMEGLTYSETEEFVRGIQPIYNDFFNHKMSPAQLYEVPAYKKLVESELGYKAGSDDMWGRHWRFWQQLDSLNLAEVWAKVDCPVLVLHGTADYEQCSMVEPMLIRQTVNESHPGNATQVIIEGIDHFMMNSKDWKEAYLHFKNQEYNKGNFNHKMADETINWLKRIGVK